VKIKLFIFLYMLPGLSSITPFAEAADPTCRDKNTLCINVARVATTGDKIRGPVTIILNNVNTLRYDVNIGETVTFTSGPDLSKLGFIPPVSAEAKPSGGVTPKTQKPLSLLGLTVIPSGGPPPDLVAAFNALSNKKDDLRNKTNDLRRIVSSTVDTVNHATSAVEAVVRASDSTLQAEDGRSTLVQSVSQLEGTIGPALKAPWPADEIAQLAAGLDKLKADVNELPTRPPGFPAVVTMTTRDVAQSPAGQKIDVADSSGFRKGTWIYVDTVPNLEMVQVAGVPDNTHLAIIVSKPHPKNTRIAFSDAWSDWYAVPEYKQAYDTLKSDLDDLRSKISEIDRNSDKDKAYQDAIHKLGLWRPYLTGIGATGEKAFIWSKPEGCGFTFGNNKEIKILLNKHDRLSSDATSASSQEIITVVCSSPLSVSAGFGLGTLGEEEFGTVQAKGPNDTNGNPATVSQFGPTKSSNFRVLPAVLLNTRIYECNEKVALHLSTGAAVSLTSGAVGNEPEYLFGISFSFSRTLFITIGGEVGREAKLAGGFKPGDPVPSGVGSPPITKNWGLGFLVAFTFRIH